MSNKEDIKGSTPAKIVGVFICIYGVMMFCVSLFASDGLNVGTVILMLMASLAMLVGIGLINLNYYAWFTAIILSLLVVLSGGLTLVLSFINSQVEVDPNLAPKLFWQVIFLWLLYASRNACRAKKEKSSSLISTIKYHSPVLAATFSTVITIIVIKSYGFGAFFILGFPILIIEFAIIYLIGGKLQKKFGWDIVINSETSNDITAQQNAPADR